jgi:hypothetical protein
MSHLTTILVGQEHNYKLTRKIGAGSFGEIYHGKLLKKLKFAH